MRYDYSCNHCSNIQEEVHGMLERPVVVCHNCGYECSKLISTDVQFCGVDGTAQMYNFVDVNTTGKPVVINSKTQWRNHLRKHGLNDDVKNDPLTKSDLDGMVRKEQNKKLENRKNIRSGVIESLKKSKTAEFKHRAKRVIQKGG